MGLIPAQIPAARQNVIAVIDIVLPGPELRRMFDIQFPDRQGRILRHHLPQLLRTVPAAPEIL